MLLLPTLHLPHITTLTSTMARPKANTLNPTTVAATTTAIAATPATTTTTKKRRTTTTRTRKAQTPTTSQRKRTPEATTPTASDIEDFPPSDARAIRASLLLWYDCNKRDLPWRRPHDQGSSDGDDLAYAVWVSEVMLQQTRVAAVVSYYDRWMRRWPTIRDLAGATQEEVNEMWAGLGYYRRARFLLEGAKSIVERVEFPSTASELRKVRGIGDYTAGAIASIAFSEVVPVVDGNVVRVITRLKAIASNPKESATIKTIWKLAGQLVDPSRPGDFNQALMELGATLCSVTSPSCSNCPISTQCHALALSKSTQSVMVTNFPAKVAKPKQRLEFAAVCVVEIPKSTTHHNGNGSHVFLLVKRPNEGLLAGLWEFPSVIIDGNNTAQKTRRNEINRYLKKSFSLDLETNCSVTFRHDVGEYLHVFSHIRLHMYVELLILSCKDDTPGPLHEKTGRGSMAWKLVDEESIKTMGLTSGIRKVYNMIGDFKKKEGLSSSSKILPRKRRKSMPK